MFQSTRTYHISITLLCNIQIYLTKYLNNWKCLRLVQSNWLGKGLSSTISHRLQNRPRNKTRIGQRIGQDKTNSGCVHEMFMIYSGVTDPVHTLKIFFYILGIKLRNFRTIQEFLNIIRKFRGFMPRIRKKYFQCTDM